MIFIEIETNTGLHALNANDIRRITPAEPERGTARCYITTHERQFTALGKSYAAILELLRAAGATLVTRSVIDFGDSSQ